MPQAAGLLLGSSLETVILLSADCKLGLAGDRNIYSFQYSRSDRQTKTAEKPKVVLKLKHYL